MQDEEAKKQKYKELLDSYFEVKGDKNSFKNSMNKTISAIVEKFFEIIVYYFQKYPEPEFHKRMQNKYVLTDKKTGEQFLLDGFDFIGDFKKFHKPKYMASMMAVRLNKMWFKFNEERIYHILIGLLEIKGWVLYDHEKESIRQTVKRFKNIIYHGVDNVKDLD